MKTTSSLILRLALALACLIPMLGLSADLPPSGTNTISGRLRFTNVDPTILDRLNAPGDEGVSAFSIIANSAPPDSLSATKFIYTNDRLGGNYALTVAANDIPLIYTLYGVASLDSANEEYWTAAYPAASVTSNSPPVELNIDECVAILDIRYQRADGTPVAIAGSRALVTENATGAWRARYLTQPAGRTGNFLAVPSGIELQLSIEVDIGGDIYLDRLTHLETRVMTLVCDELSTVTITIPEAGALGRIVGQANMTGEIEFPTEGYQELLGRPVIKASGPRGNQRYAALGGEFPNPDSIRPFALENLVPSEPAQPWNYWLQRLVQGRCQRWLVRQPKAVPLDVAC